MPQSYFDLDIKVCDEYAEMHFTCVKTSFHIHIHYQISHLIHHNGVVHKECLQKYLFSYSLVRIWLTPLPLADIYI